MRLGPRGDLALLGLQVALGLTAILDPADHLHWMDNTAVAALVLGPLVGWCVQPWLARERGGAERTHPAAIS
ncbi:MAG: hypothetical protein JOZ82_07080 [Marmoricola sp.]|nr:hypothetical protein [Marmoricola sp.]